MGLLNLLFPDSSKALTGIKEYSSTILQLIPKGTTPAEYHSALKDIITNYKLNETEIQHAIKKALNSLTEDAKKKEFADDLLLSGLINFMDYASLDKENYYVSTIYNLNQRWLIDIKQELPVLDFSELNIIPKKNELLHYVEQSYLCKNIRHTTGGYYGGLTASFKICKGLHYRIGAGSINTNSTYSLDSIDNGSFWITNLRIGFIGDEKSFSIPINKILSFDGDGEYLFIHKENTETPKIVKPTEYELACSILSNIVNQ